MKRLVLALLFAFAISTGVSAMNAYGDEQQTIEQKQQPQEEKQNNTALWIAIITGCITPIAIALINKNKRTK